MHRLGKVFFQMTTAIHHAIIIGAMFHSSEMSDLVRQNTAAAKQKLLVVLIVAVDSSSSLTQSRFGLVKQRVVATKAEDTNLVLDSSGHSDGESIIFAFKQVMPVTGIEQEGVRSCLLIITQRVEWSYMVTAITQRASAGRVSSKISKIGSIFNCK